MAERTFVDSRAEIDAMLGTAGMGFLGLSDATEPYVVPLNYAYAEGKIIFHCALEGRKLDCLRARPRVCFSIAQQIGKVEAHFGTACHVDNESVICLGEARIVDEPQERARLLNVFNRCFKPDAAEIPVGANPNCAVVTITLTEMTGRRELARKVTYWRHRF